MATQTANEGLEAGKPQPQTTAEPPGGPFIRHSQPGRMPQYTVSTIALGNTITQPLVARPGYYSRFRMFVQAKGGVNGTHTVAARADAPYNFAAQLVFKDAFGTPIFVGPGYTILKLVPLISGGFGTIKYADIANLPSFSAVSVGTAGTGNFKFATCLPLEFTKALGVIAGANASLPPSLNISLNGAAQIYSTAPGTLPKLTLLLDSDYYWLPEGITIEPPGLGTTRQWLVQQANPTVGSTGTARLQFPRLGGYLTILCLVLRNKTGVRYDGWPGYATNALTNPTARLRIIVDGIPLWDTTIGEALDDFAIAWPTVTRPVGVLAFSRRNAINQSPGVLGLLDSGEAWLSTNPGTLVEVTGSPWGTFPTGPITMNVLLGQVVPAGALIQGLPEV